MYRDRLDGGSGGEVTRKDGRDDEGDYEGNVDNEGDDEEMEKRFISNRRRVWVGRRLPGLQSRHTLSRNHLCPVFNTSITLYLKPNKVTTCIRSCLIPRQQGGQVLRKTSTLSASHSLVMPQRCRLEAAPHPTQPVQNKTAEWTLVLPPPPLPPPHPHPVQ